MPISSSTWHISPDWSFTRMRNVPALEWMQSGKHFDVHRVQRLVDRARQMGPFPFGEADDVIVTRDDWPDTGGRTHARYGVTVSDARAETRVSR